MFKTVLKSIMVFLVFMAMSFGVSSCKKPDIAKTTYDISEWTGAIEPDSARFVHIQDLRTDQEKKYRNFKTGVGFYLGDSQIVPGKCDLLVQKIASTNRNLNLEVSVKKFDVQCIVSTKSPKSPEALLSGFQKKLEENAAVGVGAGLSKLNPKANDLIKQAGLDSKIKPGEEAYVIKVDIELDVNGRPVIVSKAKKFSVFITKMDSPKIKRTVYEALDDALNEVVKQLEGAS